MIREIPASEITKAVENLYASACVDLGGAELAALKRALRREKSPPARKALAALIENARIAKAERLPICQDTGLAVVFLEIGQDVHFTGGSLRDAVNEGVRRAVRKAYLRASVVKSPIERKNTGDNTPAVIHTEIVPGSKVKIIVDAKGGGSENMSAVAMLKPSDGHDGIVAFVLDCVRRAGANPCPPIVVGVGVGGNFEAAPLLAKKSLLRPLGTPSRDKRIAALEAELLRKINKLGIGAAGFGGATTALAVHVEEAPCHIASLPVAVNIDCHAHRRKSKAF